MRIGVNREFLVILLLLLLFYILFLSFLCLQSSYRLLVLPWMEVYSLLALLCHPWTLRYRPHYSAKQNTFAHYAFQGIHRVVKDFKRNQP